MKKNFWIIFLFSLMIMTINKECTALNDIFYCDFYWEILKLDCYLRNCENCEICDDNLKCASCIKNYIPYDNKKYCVRDESASKPPIKDIKCYQNCKNCSSSPTDNNMNCISCKVKYYKINGTDNCFDLTLLNENYYLKNNIFYTCNENCLTCSDKKNGTSNNCLSCDNKNKGLYLLEDKKIVNIVIFLDII